MEITLAVEEIFDKGLWMSVCEMKGLSEWAVNEGMLSSQDKITFNKEECEKLGLINKYHENNWW